MTNNSNPTFTARFVDGRVTVTAPSKSSDEAILERIERQLEERQQEYDAEGFHLRLQDASEQFR